jgi:ribosomal protein L32
MGRYQEYDYVGVVRYADDQCEEVIIAHTIRDMAKETNACASTIQKLLKAEKEAKIQIAHRRTLSVKRIERPERRYKYELKTKHLNEFVLCR